MVAALLGRVADAGGEANVGKARRAAIRRGGGRWRGRMKLSRWELRTRRTGEEDGDRREEKTKEKKRGRERNPDSAVSISPYQDKVRLWEAQG